LDFLNNNFISDFFLILLNGVYSIVRDYSVAIILVTILLRLAMLPLDIRQKSSSRKMALIQPMVESIKKRYANNPQQLNAKTRELYKKEGVRPLAGCLPMLITLPIFFAFFGAMRVLAAQQTVSLVLNAQYFGQTAYHLPQWLWVHNFWQPDSGLASIMPTAPEFVSFVQTNATYITPQAVHMLSHAGTMQNVQLINFDYASGVMSTTIPQYDSLIKNITDANHLTGFNNGWFILPVLAGGTLFIQQKITMGQPGGQAAGQGKMMLWFFPLFSIYICASSNAAFSVYWLVANVYALGQLLVLNYIYKKREAKAKGIIEEAP
jgi:YidC/Oxa1 family membrane protein insertase